MNLTEAKAILHIDNDYNDTLITALIAAITSYIKTRTGLNAAEQANEPMCEVAASLLLDNWYNKPEDARTINRAVNDILSAVQIKKQVGDTTNSEEIENSSLPDIESQT